MLHVPTRRLRQHTPSFVSLNVLPYKYERSAPEPTQWLAFLRSLWGDDRETIETLQEWFGYCLTPETKSQKIMFLHGAPRAGKGTVPRVLSALVGENNCAGPTLSSLCGEFGLQPLLGKQLAIIADARLSGKSNKSALLERLLSVSGEDAQSINRKNREAWYGRLRTRFMIISNDIPDLPDASGAFASRCIVLAFRRSFLGGEDIGLERKLLAELPGVLNWALTGLDRLQARGGIFRQPTSAEEVITELYDLANPVAPFVREECKVEPGLSVERNALFDRFTQWSREMGHRVVPTKSQFGQKLRAAVPGTWRGAPEGGGQPARWSLVHGAWSAPPPAIRRSPAWRSLAPGGRWSHSSLVQAWSRRGPGNSLLRKKLCVARVYWALICIPYASGPGGPGKLQVAGPLFMFSRRCS